jgi:hypothetical protein
MCLAPLACNIGKVSHTTAECFDLDVTQRLNGDNPR